MVSERPLDAALVRVDIAFQHDFGLGRYLQVDSLAVHHFDRGRAQEAREDHFVEILRKRSGRGVSDGRIASERHSDGHPLSTAS